MPDDLDNKLLGAMKSLDDQVPSGYFEALPNQILARLEDGSMQQGSSTSMVRDKRDLLTGPPVAATPAPKNEAKNEAKNVASSADRSEDSGLHDIRNLAQSTKQRLSSRRSTQNPPISDEDLLATSSGSWKHVALPEPAKMVSLPSIAELPPMSDVIAADKKARSKKDKTAPPPTSDEVLAPIATANAALDSLTAKPAVIAERQAFSLPSQQNKRSKGPLLAVLGLGAAAAAGGLIFMQMNKDEKAAPAAAASQNTVATAEPTTAPEPTPPPAPAVEAVAAGSAADEVPAEAAPAAAEAPAEEAESAADTKADKPGKRSAKGKKSVTKDEPDEVKVEEKKVEPKAEPKVEPKKAGGEGEPSFDALLKEAGVEEKKEAKPKLAKKSLTGDDFKQGMGAISDRAQGCYKGTQGTAMVKLTVAPSGKVSKVSVSGAFAGKPEAACIQAAVKSATFPPWDGGPQSFSYSYMLAD